MALFYRYVYERRVKDPETDTLVPVLVHFYAASQGDADAQYEETYGNEVKKFVKRFPW